MSSKVSWDYFIYKLNLLFVFLLWRIKREDFIQKDTAILINSDPYLQEKYENNTLAFIQHY